jgi:RNA polymerase sigma factor (TIGR02999 family)
MPPLESEFEQMLQRSSTDQEAFKEAFTAIYDELRSRSSRLLGRRPIQSLGATGLVHEVYLKLVGASLDVQNESHFYHLAAKAMRMVLVDYQRHRSRAKRDPGEVVTLDEEIPHDARMVDLLVLHEALERLEKRREHLADIVELHFFAGLSFPKIAELLGISLSTVERGWRTARALLYSDMNV